MTEMDSDLRVFVSAAEPSADLHAAGLIRAVAGLWPGASFAGVAGPKMQQMGCECIFDMTQHSSMLTGAFGHVHHGYQMLSLARRELRSRPYDAAVVVDSPILNLRIAKRAKLLKIPVLYYIAPQLWAWAGSLRIAGVRAGVDRLACILPFEEPYFRAYGLDASYVGHPLFASLQDQAGSDRPCSRRGSDGGLMLAIMPGSRRHVAAENFPGQLQVAARLRQQFTDLRVLVSVAGAEVRGVLDQVARGVDVPLEFHEGRNGELLSISDVVLVSSGTATLEAAYHHTPMVVMYNSSRLLYKFFRPLISTKYLSLPNILANRELVPEFMPYYTSIEPIVARAAALLGDGGARKRMSAELAELVRPFLKTRAAETTARILLDLIEARRRKAAR